MYVLLYGPLEGLTLVVAHDVIMDMASLVASDGAITLSVHCSILLSRLVGVCRHEKMVVVHKDYSHFGQMSKNFKSPYIKPWEKSKWWC